MKKIVSLLALTLSLSLALHVPVLAAESGMGRFKAVSSYSLGQFQDVPEGVWYEEALGRCVSYGLLNGASDTEFAPKSSLTVAQALVMAARVHRIYAEGNGAFAQSDPWYQSALDYALDKGLVREGEFADYTATASRAQMAGLFARALPAAELKAVNAAPTLPDVTAATPFSQEILTLYRAGVVSGGDIYGTYYPTASVSRAEAAAIMARVVFPELRRGLDLFLPSELTLDKTAHAAKDGAALAGMGERMRTRFFDFAVTGAYTLPSLPGYTPAKGNQLLVIRVVAENTYHNQLPMYDVDFQVCWDTTAEDAYAFPLTQTGLVSSQLPLSYLLAPGGCRGGVLVYEIPDAAGACTVIYEEYFDDNTVGDVFFVTVTPERK